jgi:release factor glutamine methyltransferase
VTVLEVIQRSTEFLARKGIESPRLQVELLLAHTLRVPRLKLYLDFERPLTEAELEAMRQLVKRRSGHEPLQHIVGSVSFCGLELAVTRDVLIPRPETEELAERAWRYLQGRASGGTILRVLDFGTGSGCLAIAVAHAVKAVEVDAVDASGAALEVARQNAVKQGVGDRVHFHHGDGFAAVAEGERFDLILSNPPYIPSAEIAQLAPEVREYDPRLALDGGADGLECLRRLARQGREFLAPGGKLMCEFGEGQAAALRTIFQERGWVVEEMAADLSGRARFLVARDAES